jgi:aspartate/methionine/tyrosine aminotransferase
MGPGATFCPAYRLPLTAYRLPLTAYRLPLTAYLRSMSTARRTHGFRESVIRGMSRLALEHRAINLAQGFPNFPAPDLLKEAAARAIREDINQYAITWGARSLREALARKYERLYGLGADPEREITVTCGATEAMISTMLALVNPGDEVIVFEPFYENYGPDTILADARPVYVPLEPGRPLDLERLAAAFSPRTRAVIVNTPSNPSGRVLSQAELEAIAALCIRHDALAVTDEIYEHIRFEGEHVPIATLPGMRERTVTISGASKTFSVTGWRIGWIVAPAELTDAIRKVHDFLTVGAPAPLQEAVATAIDELPPAFYADLAAMYRGKRDLLYSALCDAGFRCLPPEGAYYILTEFSGLGPAAPNGAALDDTAFAVWLSRDIGVTPVPGSSFYRDGGGRSVVRFVFCKTEEILAEAARRLRGIHGGPVVERAAEAAAESGLQR